MRTRHGRGYTFAALLLWCFTAVSAEEMRAGVRVTPPAAEIRLRHTLDCMARGRAMFREGDYLHAAMQFEKILRLDPENAAAGSYLKQCEKLLGEE